MTLEFGRATLARAEELSRLGKDANQIAAILCDRDSEGYNFGIGIVIESDGKPMRSSKTLLDALQHELASCEYGRYLNSADSMGEFKARMLEFQGVPRSLWDSFEIAVPSDAGTGAVKLALEYAFVRNDELTALHVEELGWPAYRSMATALRKGFAEVPMDGIVDGAGALPVYQAGPLNTTGLVHEVSLIEARAESAAKRKVPVVLDRAYPGFEFTHQLGEVGYAAVVQKSYELQIEPYVKRGVPLVVACSPTKSFASFSLRPAGFVMAFCPDKSEQAKVARSLATLIRARGSAFEHPVTRAFVRAVVSDLPALQRDHQAVLRRIGESELQWRRLVRGTAIEPLYGARYAGLYRNPRVKPEGAAALYAKHIYPVISSGRCRHNVTGLVADPTIAAQLVAAFAEQCTE
ncbi:MAG TPA: aminotransferase class I/II-fold pyridoxal phosphate-dependent enzyme [Polyangiaceae bacterium]|nr:aminotransferase class I/II-fold pyridoxal phosphate-dependent enzyme [Polyangiaceae bacterium]